jgi:hypothetical protein
MMTAKDASTTQPALRTDSLTSADIRFSSFVSGRSSAAVRQRPLS